MLFCRGSPCHLDRSGEISFCRGSPCRGLSFLSSLKETKQRKVRKRPELGGRNHDFSKHSMNSLRSNSISYFVAQIACCNPRLNIASKNHTSYKCLLVRNVFEEFIRSVVILDEPSEQARNRTSGYMFSRI